MENKLPDSFCWAPYINVDLNQDGKFYPCYRSKVRQGDWKTGNLVAEYNNDSMQQLRDDLWNGRENANCVQCHRREAEGVESTRQQYNKHMQKDFGFSDELIEGIVLNHKIADVANIKTMEIRPHGMCTNACAHCDENSSSRWIKMQGLDSEKFLLNYKDEPEVLNEFFETVEDIKSIHFTGGEPLLYPKTHIKTLEKLPKNIELRYHSALKEQVHEDIISLWEQFDKVKIFASIDTSDKYFHWFRYGSNWTTVMENIEEIRYYLNVEVQAVITVNLLTMLDFGKLVRDLVDNELFFNIAFVDPPHQLSCVYLGNDKKRKANNDIAQAKVEVKRYKDEWMTRRALERIEKVQSFMHSHYDSPNMWIESKKLLQTLDGVYNIILEDIDKSLDYRKVIYATPNQE
jgi:organic radical activating enzyme